MKQIKLGHTTILHEPRLRFGLTNNDYCIASSIYHLSNNPSAPFPGWCSASRETLGSFFGICRRTAISICNKLIEKDFVERHDSTGFLRTTRLWYNEFECFGRGAKVAQGVQEVDTGSAETAQGGCNSCTVEGAEVAHNNDIDNNSNKDTDSKALHTSDFEETLFGLETKKEKEKPPVAAAPQPGKAVRQVKPLQYFKDSLWNDAKYTTEFFQGTTFANVDWPYYLKKFSAWSDLKKKKRDEAGWQKTMETWIIKDHNAGTLLTIGTKLGNHAINKPSSNGKQTGGQSFDDIKAKYRKSN